MKTVRRLFAGSRGGTAAPPTTNADPSPRQAAPLTTHRQSPAADFQVNFRFFTPLKNESGQICALNALIQFLLAIVPLDLHLETLMGDQSSATAAVTSSQIWFHVATCLKQKVILDQAKAKNKYVTNGLEDPKDILHMVLDEITHLDHFIRDLICPHYQTVQQCALAGSECHYAVGVAEGKGHSQLKMTILPGAQREKFANLRPYDLGEHNKKASEKCPFGHEDMHEVNYATYLPPVLLIPIDHSDGNHTLYLRKHDIDGRMFTRGASGTEFEEARQPRHAYSLLAFITYSSGGIGHYTTTRQFEGKWYEMNDRHCKEVEPDYTDSRGERHFKVKGCVQVALVKQDAQVWEAQKAAVPKESSHWGHWPPFKPETHG